MRQESPVQALSQILGLDMRWARVQNTPECLPGQLSL